MKLTAGASAHVLIDALERAGWGSLDTPDMRGVRVVLAALTRTLDPRSGSGKATAEQIARRAGYTARWARRCLQVLEDLELIEWDRGGIVDGRPVPSWFRVSKRGLVALVALARQARNVRDETHRTETRARISRYRLRFTSRKKQGRHRRRSDHEEVISPLLSVEDGSEAARDAAAPREAPIPADPERTRELIAATRARIRAQRGSRPRPAQVSSAATTGRRPVALA